ncbi:MAG: 2-oxoglutarate and iron-dependent oxygenase domain-containing protein [Chitinophagales bacterium]|nr:isopenicillin N synthase family oxygenase [Bacteroidota bacterium]
MNTIPTINLADFLSGDAKRKQDFVNAIGKAYQEVGFVAVRNHGVNKNSIDDFYDAVQHFFSLPETIKHNYEIDGLAGQRGYTSFGKEHAKGSTAADLKEFWQFGQTVTDNAAIKNEYPDNVEVNELPNFNLLGVALYKNFENSGRELLRAIALYLGLNENYFDNKIHNGNSILRAIYYPPITEEPASAVRAEQHEDINLITLLVGASADGLEVMSTEGNWVPVKTAPDEIVVNVGDMLQRLTNNILKSTTHRVVNPPKEKWSTPRYSIPFFLHPKSDVDLTCLASCINENNPLQYEPITAGGYLDERLREIGLK